MQRLGRTSFWRVPFLDKILVERSAAKTNQRWHKVPEKSQGKVLQTTAVTMASGPKERLARANQSVRKLETKFSQNTEAPK